MHSQLVRAAVVIVAVAIGTGQSLAAQEDAKATQVLVSTRREIGGPKLEALTSLSVQGSTERNVGNFQLASDLELLLEMPDKYSRSETSNSAMVNMASTTGFNGDRPIKGNGPAGFAAGGGMIIRMGGPGPGGPVQGTAEKLTPEQQQQIDKQAVLAARNEISRLMLGWFGMSHPTLSVQYTYAGEAESADGKAHIIDVKNAGGFAARLFIDQKTHLPLMVTYQGPQPRIVTAGGPGRAGAAQTPARPASEEERRGLADEARRQVQQMQKEPPQMIEYTLFFDDWRSVDGIKFPFTLRRASAGSTTEEWTIAKVKVNPKIDSKKFETTSAGER